MPSNRTQLALLPLGAVCLCLTGSSVMASCGDYLHTRLGPPAMVDHENGSSAQPNGHRDQTEHTAAETQPERVQVWQQRTQHNHAQPCSGPGCRSSRDQRPNSKAPLPVDSSPAPKALTASGERKSSVAGLPGVLIDDPTNHSNGGSSRIERPPQPVAKTIGIVGVTSRANLAPAAKQPA